MNPELKLRELLMLTKTPTRSVKKTLVGRNLPKFSERTSETQYPRGRPTASETVARLFAERVSQESRQPPPGIPFEPAGPPQIPG
jgi:hypothetical protein